MSMNDLLNKVKEISLYDWVIKEHSFYKEVITIDDLPKHLELTLKFSNFSQTGERFISLGFNDKKKSSGGGRPITDFNELGDVIERCLKKLGYIKPKKQPTLFDL